MLLISKYSFHALDVITEVLHIIFIAADVNGLLERVLIFFAVAEAVGIWLELRRVDLLIIYLLLLLVNVLRPGMSIASFVELVLDHFINPCGANAAIKLARSERIHRFDSCLGLTRLLLAELEQLILHTGTLYVSLHSGRRKLLLS